MSENENSINEDIDITQRPDKRKLLKKFSLNTNENPELRHAATYGTRNFHMM
jgi:hypothetical protein